MNTTQRILHPPGTIWRLVWSPTGQEIARVEARTRRAAIRKAPAPFRRYLGEIWAGLA